MNPLLALFCLDAAERGIFSQAQGSILLDICSPDASLAEFVDFIMSTGIASNEEDIIQLMNEKAEFLDVKAGEIEKDRVDFDDGEGADDFSEREHTAIPLELEWFCFYGVCEGVLDEATCRGIVSVVADTGDVLAFAQAMLDMGICEDPVMIQELKDKAAVEALNDAVPPFSIFREQRIVK